MLLTLLPTDEPDLQVGPVLVSHGRVLAVGLDHPLGRESVDIEDLAGWVLLDGPAELPEALRHGFCPPFTPDRQAPAPREGREHLPGGAAQRRHRRDGVDDP
ncbi:hypothetical protein E4K10_18750 [Streptomyces sp. T1317-0309]|nr:hypothetical protein E4K10_18750 [Streptomyces sp. T1317-0309]